MTTLRVRLLLATCLLSLPACGPATPEVAEVPIDRTDPAVFYPMRANAQWVYDVDTGGGEPPTLGIFEVIEREGATAQIANNRGMDRNGQVSHGDPMGYEVVPEGIRHVASDGWLLRRPIEAGAEWSSIGGRTARITDADATAEVFAGTYEHCLEVTETGDEAGRTIRTVYCPEIGPVIMESSLSTELTMRTVSTRATLRSYDDGAAVSEEP
ncbi:MAG: hypothetical protein AB8I08_03550 [Sandaracinaceae bacterium]